MFRRIGTPLSNSGPLFPSPTPASATGALALGRHVSRRHYRHGTWSRNGINAGPSSRDRLSVLESYEAFYAGAGTGNHGPVPSASRLRSTTCADRRNGLPSPSSHTRLSSSLSSSSSPRQPPISRLSRGFTSSSSSTPPRASPPPATPSFTRALYHTASPPGMYTTSFAFFEALSEAGITHVFVNLGSDHPSIIEAMVKGQREAREKFPRIITCPNEVSAPITPAASSVPRYYRSSGELVLTPPHRPRWSPCPWPTATPA